MQPVKAIYYYWGGEPYLLDKSIREVIAQIQARDGEEPEELRLDGDEMSSLELGEALHSGSLFSLSRVVSIKNPAWLGKSNRKIKKAEEMAHILEDYGAAAPAGQTLVICSPEYAAANPAAKVLNKIAQVENIKGLSPRSLEEWIKDKCDQMGLAIEPAAIHMLSSSGQDMYYLENLIKKAALSASKSIIKAADLTDDLDVRQETSIFKLTDALLNRNAAAALTAFQQLQEQGQPYLLMLHMIVGQLTTLAKIKFWQESGYSSSQIAEMGKQKDFVIRKMQEKSSKFTSEDIQVLFKKLLDLDISLKSQSKDQRVLMEILIADFCTR